MKTTSVKWHKRKTKSGMSPVRKHVRTVRSMNLPFETPVYVRDLNKDIANDEFFGKGFKAMVKKAEKKNKEVVVGYWLERPKIE
jgi:hypothetical protein